MESYLLEKKNHNLQFNLDLKTMNEKFIDTAEIDGLLKYIKLVILFLSLSNE